MHNLCTNVKLGAFLVSFIVIPKRGFGSPAKFALIHVSPTVVCVVSMALAVLDASMLSSGGDGINVFPYKLSKHLEIK